MSQHRPTDDVFAGVVDWHAARLSVLIDSHSKIPIDREGTICYLNLLKPEFAIVIFIHYKPRIAVTIFDL